MPGEFKLLDKQFSFIRINHTNTAKSKRIEVKSNLVLI